MPTGLRCLIRIMKKGDLCVHRSAVCGMVIKGMLDKIEKEEKLEHKRQKKQESAEERQKRLNTVSQQRALFKHKEALKKEILKKRAAMEKSLQQEIYVSHSPWDIHTSHVSLATVILNNSR